MIDSFTMPTILFISHHPHSISRVHIGAEALEKFENGENGRYLHSIKRSLHDRKLTSTIINNRKITIPELVRFFLEELNRIITHKWGIVPRNIVLGRPVIFSPDREEDDLAQSRLLEGFKMAGYKEITLLEEPVAAALCFESHLENEDRHFMIVDLGGGTSDFTIVERDPGKSGIEKYNILCTHGINVGGDHFDEDIMFAKISDPLGINATYTSFQTKLPMPVHLYRDISKWNMIHAVDRRKINRDFDDYKYKSSDREAVLKLKHVMENNLSRKILHKVRESKHELSREDQTTIEYADPGLTLKEKVSKPDFQDIIDTRTRSITDNMGIILKKTGLGPSDMDKIILTGGSSQIGYIQDVIAETFDKEKMLVDGNLHNSVSEGLSAYAYYNDIKIT